MKLKYYTEYNLPPITPECCGDKIVKMYQMQKNKDGDTELVCTGTRDQNAVIQSHKNSCDINYILERAKNDPRILNMSTMQYLDLTELPSNIYEASDMIERAKDSFMNLPVDIREKFDNNPEKFVRSYDEGKMPDIVRDYIDRNFNTQFIKPNLKDENKGAVEDVKE